jgi:KaiC/GvpD/RAD55 family RecA-like ATPase
MIARVKTGIPGLDPVLQGGFLQDSVNLLTGATGTGKTIFCLQFLWYGLQKGDSCVYISLEEDPGEIKEDALEFGWDLSKYEKKGLFKVLYHDPSQVTNIGPVVMEEIKSLKAKRIVIDSVSLLGLSIENLSQIRKRILSITNTIKRAGCTAIMVSEIPHEQKAISRFGVEEFVADSVVILNYMDTGGNFNRSLMVRKMRRTNHGKDIYPYTISSKGITVKKSSI